MQGFPAGVNAHRHHIFIEEHPQRIAGSIFREPGDSIAVFQPLHHGLLHNRLDIRRAEQLALDGRSLCHPELAVFGYKVLPGYIPGALKQFLKGLRLKASRLEKHPLCGAQKHIGAANGLVISYKRDAAVLHQGYLISQVQNFFFKYCLQPKMAGGN